jgi:hypothetical protein
MFPYDDHLEAKLAEMHIAQRAGDAARDEIATRIPAGERAPWLATLRHIRNLPDAP